MTSAERISAAKAQMILSEPWWATLLLHLEIRESQQVPTMATDGNYLLYNPKFVKTLSAQQLKGVLIHEVAHCALLHPSRRAWREPLRWNIAADQAVNALLFAAGIALPADCVPPAELNKTAEEIYDDVRVTKITQDVYAPGELGEGGEQSATSSTLPTPAAQKVCGAAEATEKKWRDILASARGFEPANLHRAIGEAEKPRVNWRAELARWVSARVKSDEHTWSRPSRRVVGLPGWKREPAPHIAVCLDTSGSVSSALLTTFCDECRAILALAGIRAHVISADAAVHQVIEPGEPFPDALGGGGGTDFRPAIKKAHELAVDGIVYFTDADGEFGAEPPIPILWALSQPNSPPWGEKIQIEEEK